MIILNFGWVIFFFKQTMSIFLMDKITAIRFFLFNFINTRKLFKYQKMCNLISTMHNNYCKFGWFFKLVFNKCHVIFYIYIICRITITVLFFFFFISYLYFYKYQKMLNNLTNTEYNNYWNFWLIWGWGVF